jgi:hypothetical protein
MISMDLLGQRTCKRIGISGRKMCIQRNPRCLAQWLKREARSYAIWLIGPGIKRIDRKRCSIDDERMEVTSIFLSTRKSIWSEAGAYGGLFRVTDNKHGRVREIVACRLRLEKRNEAQNGDQSAGSTDSYAMVDGLAEKVHS